MNKIKVSSRILKNLSSPDVSKRRAAAESLADGDERAIYPLIQALRDTHPGVQDAATRSLIAIGGEVTAWMVLPLLREEAFFRNTAMVILKEIGAVALHHLPPLLRDKDDDVRKFAIEFFDEDPGEPGSDAAAGEPDWDVKKDSKLPWGCRVTLILAGNLVNLRAETRRPIPAGR